MCQDRVTICECEETDTAKIAAAHGIDPRAVEDTLHALCCCGWHFYPPGHPVVELVEAAKVYAAGLANPTPWEIGSPVTCLDRLEQAARKVAGEATK